MQLFRQFPNGLAETRADDQTGRDVARIMRKKHDPGGSEAQQPGPYQWLDVSRCKARQRTRNRPQMHRMSGWKRIPRIARAGNTMPRPMHKCSIRAFTVDQDLEHMRQQASDRYAEHHAVGFVTDLFGLGAELGSEPEQADQTQQYFFIRQPGHNL
jgi:hypothetical protein